MKYILFSIFSIVLLLNMNVALADPASVYSWRFGTSLWEGDRIIVLVKVRGEPESQEPDNRAREIRFLQGAVLKFAHFSKATNVKSDTWDNQFTATVTTALAEVLERRGDVTSVTVLGTISEKIEKKNCSAIYPGADLSGCNLFALRAMNMDLRAINFSNTNLKGAWLQGSDLSGADLNHAFMRHAVMNGANLTNADLSYIKLFNGEVFDADLTNATFYGATLYRADFTGSTMKNTNLGLTILTFGNLSFVDLEGANLDQSGTWGTNLNHCTNHPICRR